MKRGTSNPGYNVAVSYNPSNGLLPAYMPAFAFDGATLAQATQQASPSAHASGAAGACQWMHLRLRACACGREAPAGQAALAAYSPRLLNRLCL